MGKRECQDQLRRLYEIVRNQHLDFRDDENADVIDDLDYREDYIVGLASRILDDERISPKENGILQHPVLAGSTYFGMLLIHLSDGSMEEREYDLSSKPDLLRCAQNLENLRISCIDALSFS